MELPSLELYGQALLDFTEVKTDAIITLGRDDGFAVDFPVGFFFRAGMGFSPIDTIALEHCRGEVLDIGAGAGCHSLALQEKDFAVTAIDSISRAVEVMKRRGVKDAWCGDIFSFASHPFDTALMLGHGVGITGDLEGLDRFLEKMHGLINPSGQLLVDSLDVRITNDPANLAYQESIVRQGGYRGEIRMRFDYRGQAGALMKWLHVDFETLQEIAAARGWTCRELHREPTGEYLACLTH
ncbi:MAG: class I SAM-dependent methyltransferase [Candidatus Latescibacterota bacterium]